MNFEDTFLDRIEKMGAAIAPYAKAKAERVYLEKFLSSQKAILMSECSAPAANAREQYALADKRYTDLLKGLKEAVELEEKTKWALEKFKIEFEHWRTMNANKRWQQDRV